MPAIPGVPVMDTDIITDARRKEIQAGLQYPIIGETQDVEIVLGTTLTQGDYDDMAIFLRVGDTTVKQWFTLHVIGGNGELGYRDCLPIDITGRRPFRISPLPGHKERIDPETGEPVVYTEEDLAKRSNMRYRLFLCATLGRAFGGIPVGFQREPLFTGQTRVTNFYMVHISACLRKMREIYEGENTFFLYLAWWRFDMFYNPDERIAPVGWFLACTYNAMGKGEASDIVQNFPAIEEGTVDEDGQPLTEGEFL